MKHLTTIVCIVIFFILLGVNFVLLRQQRELVAQLSAQVRLLKDTELTYQQLIVDNTQNSGVSLPDSITSKGKQILFRYSENSCYTCVSEAMALLENVFTRARLQHDMLIVNTPAMENPYRAFTALPVEGIFTPLDTLCDVPYLCITDDVGCIRYSMPLYTYNYEVNRSLLLFLSHQLLPQAATYTQNE